MKKRFILSYILFLFSILSLPKDSFSQGVGIGTTTPDASAALDITTTSKGLLIPRMSIASINAIVNPVKGLLVYDSVANQLMANMGTPATPNWQTIVFRSGWNLTGNSGINPANQFIGNIDNQPLRFRVNNIQAGELHPVTGNISWGLRAGQGNTTGFSNIAIGTDALKLNTITSNLVAIGDSALFNNSGGLLNTAIGSKSLFTNTIGKENTATGFQSLFSNTTGNDNTATGFASLFSNTIGVRNTATGFQSLGANTGGSNNTATGFQSLRSNTTGSSNVATGFNSLFSNTTGLNNVAVGVQSLAINNTGLENVAVGQQSLFSNTIGSTNTAVGDQSLAINNTGSSNTAVGKDALRSTTGSSFNTAIGFKAASNFNMGINNTLLGANSDINQNDLFNCVALGESSRCTASNQVRFGNSATTSIGGVVGYTNLSDGRYKKNIQEAVKGIDFIMKLRPVTYQLDMAGINKKLNMTAGGKMDDPSKKGIDENEKTIFSGFVAQEVEQAAKTVGYDFSGVDKPKNENDMYGLRYAEFVVPLVKAAQEQQQHIEALNKQVEVLSKQNDASKQIINELRKRLDGLEKKVK